MYNYYPNQATPSSCTLPGQSGGYNGGNVAGYFYQDSVNPSLSHTASYSYDSLNRLTNAAATGSSTYNFTFQYDRWGNVTCMINGQTNGPCPEYSFNSANNRITNTGYPYNAAGDLTDDTYHSYQWNGEGRMTSVDNDSTETRTFNAMGEFAQINVSGAAAEFLYTPSGHMLGVNCSGAWCEQYLPFGGRDLGYYDGPTLFLHANNIGSTTMRTTGTGSVEGDILEEPWGQNWQYLGTQRVDEDFAGFGHVDQFTWTYFTLHRNYNPSEGRWLTPDLLGGDITNPQSLNRYAYALNNPTTLTDPSGLGPNDCAPASICITVPVNPPFSPPPVLPITIGPCTYEAIES